MRITIEIPTSIIKKPGPSPSDPPLIQIGGDLVIMELQGDLTFEGNPQGKVIGLLGLERMDKPTLYLGKHHLLHGKIINLPRPLAIIRKVKPDERRRPESSFQVQLNEDQEEEAPPELEEETQDDPLLAASRPFAKRLASARTASGLRESTPAADIRHTTPPPTSSPPRIQSKHRDYSSDLSSPVKAFEGRKRKRIPELGTLEERDPVEEGEVDVDEEEDQLVGKRQARSTPSKKDDRGVDVEERTKEYMVIGVVRKKVVFALRPEPIVTATVLPE